ncbi:hypothetical protein Slin15195_G097090 [Septoria linicola]|uniref:Uncharacterized protein n=1 Tax=Septoria linicola TaxID=215465 RepID=A0A9Q9AWF4_9PEZI|nr:hypothetical protein Slin15195_G097090 [Septoria linicola]
MQFSTLLSAGLLLLATSAGAAPVSQNNAGLLPWLIHIAKNALRADNVDTWIASHDLERREAVPRFGALCRLAKKIFPGRKPAPGSPAALGEWANGKNFHATSEPSKFAPGLGLKKPLRQDSGIWGPRA